LYYIKSIIAAAGKTGGAALRGIRRAVRGTHIRGDVRNIVRSIGIRGAVCGEGRVYVRGRRESITFNSKNVSSEYSTHKNQYHQRLGNFPKKVAHFITSS